MKRLSVLIEPVALGILLIGGFGMMASTFLGTADVIGTQFFGKPVHGALELTESTMVLIVFGALTYSQIRRNHIRVELFYTRAGPKGQAAMDIFADLMGMLFFGFLLWQAYNEAVFSVQIDESTFGLIRIPLWPARIILAAGTALLILQLMVDLSADIERFRHGEEVVTLDDVIRKEIDAAATIIDDVDIHTKVGS
jgi:TRAP-type C4-dicarboxylate transport system permease small subunit